MRCVRARACVGVLVGRWRNQSTIHTKMINTKSEKGIFSSNLHAQRVVAVRYKITLAFNPNLLH